MAGVCKSLSIMRLHLVERNASQQGLRNELAEQRSAKILRLQLGRCLHNVLRRGKVA